MTRLVAILDQLVTLALEYRTTVVMVACLAWYVVGLLVRGVMDEIRTSTPPPELESERKWNRLRLELLVVVMLIGLVAAVVLMRGPL